MATRNEDSYSEISDTIALMRQIQRLGAKRVLQESEDKDEKEEDGNDEKDGGEETQDAVPYTDQDELLQSTLQPCKKQFGADFSKHKNPMLYYPEDGDITLSGTIPSLNNAKFQFRYLDASGNGCYLWTDSLQLTDDTLSKLNKINGIFKNWKQTLATSEDIKPLSYKNKEQ